MHPEHSLLINQTDLGETNLNTFHSWRNAKWGYTLFAGGTYQLPKDVNRDGFVDAAYTYSLFIHPTWFRYLNKHATLSVSYNLSYDYDRGGAFKAVINNDTAFGYLAANKMRRQSAYMNYKNTLHKLTINIKTAGSLFERDISTNKDFGNLDNLTYFGEGTITLPRKSNTWLFGAAINGINPIAHSIDKGNDARYLIGSLFLQNEWSPIKKCTLQAGFRTDARINGDIFPLPQLSLLFKPAKSLLLRLSGGLGYKLPSVGDYLTDERDILNTRLLNFYATQIKPEKSRSTNLDIKYTLHADEMELTFNEDVFYIYLNNNNFYNDSLVPIQQPVQSIGQEFWMRSKTDDLELYAGYTYIDAKRIGANINEHLPIIAPQKIALLASYDLWNEKLRFGLEASYTASQFRDNANNTPDFWTFAASLMLKLNKETIVLNCENLTGFKQQNMEQVVSGSLFNPEFKPIWAPLTGRVLNLSLQYRW